MPRGRKPKSRTIKLLEGNPGKRPIGEEPRFSSRIKRPAWLSATARTEWTNLVAELRTLNLVQSVDRGSLAVYCEAIADYKRACQLLAKEGAVIETAHGTKIKNPAATLKREAAELIHKIGGDFGFSPASRARLMIHASRGGATTPDPPADPLSAFVKDRPA